jgi:hypothetical protein
LDSTAKYNINISFHVVTKLLSRWKLGFPREKINYKLCMEYMKAEVDELETKSKIKNIRHV